MDPNKYFKVDVKTIMEHEYDAQLMGFTIEDFMRAIKLLVKDEVTRYTAAMTSALLKKYTDKEDPEIEQVKTLTKALINQYICASVEPLHSLENQLKDLIHIPPHLLLPKDKVQKTQYSAEDEQKIDKQIEDLFKRIKRTKSFNIELRQELQMLRDVLPQLSRRLQELEQLDQQREQCETVMQQVEPELDAISCDMENISISQLE